MSEKSALYIISASIGAFCAYIGIEEVVIYILVSAFALDFLTGMLKAHVIGNYRSKIGWIKTIAKVLGMLLIGVVGLVFMALKLPHEYFVMASLMGLALHDLISCTRNLYVIRTGQELPELDVVSMVIKKIHNTLISVVKKIFDEK
jgi:phage-related holin